MPSPYEQIPACILTQIVDEGPKASAYCAGFEFTKWRCDGLADNLLEWIIDYALKSDELLTLNHTNSYIRLRQAAARVYTSDKYVNRGEIGEIIAHAVCRKYFGTYPVAPRVNYLSASNNPVKAFDLVHVKYDGHGGVKLWLGEAKFFKNRSRAIGDAIKSIATHITQGFLTNEKLILGPQVSIDIPLSAKVRELFSSEVSLDKLISSAVFPIFIVANSDAIPKYKSVTEDYAKEIQDELTALSATLGQAGLESQIEVRLIYVPLGCKDSLSAAFDKLLKGVQGKGK